MNKINAEKFLTMCKFLRRQLITSMGVTFLFQKPVQGHIQCKYRKFITDFRSEDQLRTSYILYLRYSQRFQLIIVRIFKTYTAKTERTLEILIFHAIFLHFGVCFIGYHSHSNNNLFHYNLSSIYDISYLLTFYCLLINLLFIHSNEQFYCC